MASPAFSAWEPEASFGALGPGSRGGPGPAPQCPSGTRPQMGPEGWRCVPRDDVGGTGGGGGYGGGGGLDEGICPPGSGCENEIPPGGVPGPDPGPGGEPWDRTGQYAEDDAWCKANHGPGWEANPRPSPDAPRSCRQIGVGGGGFGGGGGGGGAGGGPPPSGGPGYEIDPAPMFDAPDFVAPTGKDVFNDPSYQFRLDQGQRALEASAAAGGTIRSGGHLRGVLEYGQQFASTEYAKTFDRALAEYDRQFQAAWREFQPEFTEWQTTTAASQREKDLAWQRAWDEYVFGINDDFRRDQLILGMGL